LEQFGHLLIIVKIGDKTMATEIGNKIYDIIADAGREGFSLNFDGAERN